jgi:hypothetical protein
MFGSDARLMTVERILAKAVRDISDLISRISRAEQNQVTGGSGGGGTSGGGTYIAYPASTIATGAFLSLTIYQCQGGTTTSIGTFELYNYLASSIQAGDGSSTFGVMCLPDGSGAFTGISQSCV